MLPEKKDKICNSKFLVEVSERKIWLPEGKRLVYRDCHNPPTVELLHRYCIMGLKKLKRDPKAPVNAI